MSIGRGVLAIAVGAVALAVAVGGCSFDISFGGDDDTVSKEQIAEKARAALDRKFGQEGLPSLPPVTCDRDLERNVGEATRCEAKGEFGKKTGTGTLGITAKITAVHDSDTEFDFTTDKRGIVPD